MRGELDIFNVAGAHFEGLTHYMGLVIYKSHGTDSIAAGNNIYDFELPIFAYLRRVELGERFVTS